MSKQKACRHPKDQRRRVYQGDRKATEWCLVCGRARHLWAHWYATRFQKQNKKRHATKDTP